MSGLCYRFQVPGDDYSRAGEASSTVKNRLKRLGVSPEAIRRVSIALYEGEINMVIHGGGGEVTVTVSPDRVDMILEDHGKGIPDIEKCHAGGIFHCLGRSPEPGLRSRHGTSQYEKSTPIPCRSNPLWA